MSPILFNIIIADRKGTLEGQDGRGDDRGKEVEVLGYADDIVILAEEQEGMK